MRMPMGHTTVRTVHRVALAAVLGGAVSGCGGDELFGPQLAPGERSIDREAVERLARDDQGIAQVVVVGDLDGDGVEDTIIRTYWLVPFPDDSILEGSAVYVRYGGAPTGTTDLSKLPTLTDVGFFDGGVARLGDVDGDGLADFLVGIGFPSGCNPADPPQDEEAHSGAYLVYGS